MTTLNIIGIITLAVVLGVGIIVKVHTVRMLNDMDGVSSAFISKKGEVLKVIAGGKCDN